MDQSYESTSVSPVVIQLHPGPSISPRMIEAEETELHEQKNESSPSSTPVQVAESSGTNLADMPGCAHYKRKCQLVCPDPTCDKVYTCRICHDEAESGHQLDRHRVKEVVCWNCKKRQPVSNCCVKCSTTFGKFFCKICNLFMDVYKDTFHCDGCGLCRVGPKENFFHCHKCAMCMPIAMGDGKHKCIEKSSQRDCPVCLEDIHTSRSSSHVPPCGHLLHQHCFNQMIRKALYTCPVCNESMIDMKVVWKYLDDQLAASPPLPPEFANEVQILCRDCHKLSTVMFHFVGLKCGSCGGYNTCIERGAALNPEAFAVHQQLVQGEMGGDGEEEESQDGEDDDEGDGASDSDSDEEYQSVEEFEDDEDNEGASEVEGDLGETMEPSTSAGNESTSSHLGSQVIENEAGGRNSSIQ